MNRTAIEILGARTHNLQQIDCRIPHGRVTVVTGPSGAGKSSLAFDTVYAEAQRRFIESMSTYSRQFLEQMERPPVEAMHNILPAVALLARNSVKNARSSVGTLTEVHDVLRLLYAHLGEVRCPNGHGPVSAEAPETVADAIASGIAGEKVLLVAALERPARQSHLQWKELVRQGFFRRLEGDEVVRMTPSQRWTRALDPLLLVLTRARATGERAEPRLVEAVEEAYRLAAGRLRVVDLEGDEPSWTFFGRRLTCRVCGATGERPVPALFSFNSPLGACPRCQGFGRVMGIDRDRVVPETSRSLREKPIAPWNSPSYEKHYGRLFSAAHERGIDLDLPWRDLSEADREWVWSGADGFVSLDKFFARLERKNYKMHVRVLLARYRAYDRCPSCAGRRLRPEALAVRLFGKDLSELSALPIEALHGWLGEQAPSPEQKARAGDLLEQLERRLATLEQVGLGYLSLDRQARTLSGGEAQRIQLATALGSGLTSTLYVLDEPTIGLHPQDSQRLLGLLHDLAERGNTVLVVEHDRTLIRGADHLVDLGPLAGEHGGRLMGEGPVEEVLRNETSLTARFLERPPEEVSYELDDPEPAVPRSRLWIRGARENNLRGFDVEIPTDALVAITGVSGSGKSTLVENVLYGTFQRSRGTVDVEPGDCDALEGLEELEDVVLVDQRPLGRSSRSNPVTYIKAYDDIRKIFAAVPEARESGIAAGHFSFNLDRGRCPECSGTGVQEVDMFFMASVSVVCDTCQGRRFRPEILAITHRGRNIHETLELSVEESLDHFADRTRLCRRLENLMDVGLGYLRLGQPTSTLSGGEAQRLKLASFLGEPAGKVKPRLFLFDEPTTGLHLADIDLLHSTLRRLVQRGHGVVVVEHSTDLVARADWIVDLGPGGGTHGGELLFSGPIRAFLDSVESPTASELREYLGWVPPGSKAGRKKRRRPATRAASR